MVYTEYILALGAQHQFNSRRLPGRRRARVRRLLPPLSMVCKGTRGEYVANEEILIRMGNHMQNDFFLAHATGSSIKSPTRWSEIQSKLDGVKKCTIQCRLDREQTALNKFEIQSFMRHLGNTEQIEIEVHCPTGTPMSYLWVKSTKKLRNSLDDHMFADDDYEVSTLFPASLKKISLSLDGQLYGSKIQATVRNPKLSSRRYYYLYHERTTATAEWKRMTLPSNTGDTPARWARANFGRAYRQECDDPEHVEYLAAVENNETRCRPGVRDERFEWQ